MKQYHYYFYFKKKDTQLNFKTKIMSTRKSLNSKFDIPKISELTLLKKCLFLDTKIYSCNVHKVYGIC